MKYDIKYSIITPNSNKPKDTGLEIRGGDGYRRWCIVSDPSQVCVRTRFCVCINRSMLKYRLICAIGHCYTRLPFNSPPMRGWFFAFANRYACAAGHVNLRCALRRGHAKTQTPESAMATHNKPSTMRSHHISSPRQSGQQTSLHVDQTPNRKDSLR